MRYEGKFFFVVVFFVIMHLQVIYGNHKQYAEEKIATAYGYMPTSAPTHCHK